MLWMEVAMGVAVKAAWLEGLKDRKPTKDKPPPERKPGRQCEATATAIEREVAAPN